jgi:hypothetical protein
MQQQETNIFFSEKKATEFYTKDNYKRFLSSISITWVCCHKFISSYSRASLKFLLKMSNLKIMALTLVINAGQTL